MNNRWRRKGEAEKLHSGEMNCWSAVREQWEQVTRRHAEMAIIKSRDLRWHWR
jgi:precorrin-4 methylase